VNSLPLDSEEPVSVNFNPYDPETRELGDRTLNLSNANARALLDWLHLPGADEPQPEGMRSVDSVRRRCMLRLWKIKKNEDLGTPTIEYRVPQGPKVIELGRRPGYLPEKAQQLYDLCTWAEESGFTHISWG
jgi:hypothetical protein